MTARIKGFLILIGVLVGLGLIGAIGFIVYNEHQLKVQQNAIQQQVVAQQQLADGITRSMSTWTTKSDLQAFATQNDINLKAIQANMASLKSSLDAINVSTATSTPITQTGLGSTTTIKEPVVDGGAPIPAGSDPYGYLANQQVLTLNETFGATSVPFGSVGFNASQPKPWNLTTYTRKYTNTQTLATDENQRLTAYNTFSINVNNKDYPINLTTSKIEQIYPTAKFYLWNPRFYLGVNGGVDLSAIKGSVSPTFSLQVMSYGKYKNLPDWSILQIGAGFDAISKRPNVLITPVSYNIGEHIPFMSNVYIGPSVGFDTAGQWLLTGGLQVGL